MKTRIMMISTHGYVSASPEFGKADTGGQVVYVLELARCLARMGYHVDVLTRRFEGQRREEVAGNRVRVLRFPCGGKVFIPKEDLWEYIPEWITSAVEYVRKKKLRYAFVNSHYWDAGMAGKGVAKALGIPHLHTPHSIGSWKRDNMDGVPEELEGQYNFKRRIREEKIVYDEADALIATTAQQRDLLMGADYDAPREKIHVIPPGYDDTHFFPVSAATRSTLRQEHGLEPDGKLVLALGRMARNKGYDLLIRAMKVVFDRIEDAKLYLSIGSGKLDETEQEILAEIKGLIDELGVADRVLFDHDYIEDEDLPNYYRMADVFCLSSRYEPFGMTAVEAMACGTPTVVTTEGGLWEQVSWGIEALYANPFDPEAFGHAIYTILQYPDIHSRLAKHGSHKARSDFTWTGVGQRLLRVLENLPAKIRL